VTLDRDLVSGVLDRRDFEQVPSLDGSGDEPEDASPPLAGPNAWGGPARRAKQSRIASGKQAAHAVASAQFGEDREVECSCGDAFTGRTDKAMAATFAHHAWERRSGARSGPAECVSAQEEEEEE